MKKIINLKKVVNTTVDDQISDLLWYLTQTKNSFEYDVSKLSDLVITELLKRLKHTSYKGYKLIYQYEKDKGVLTISTIRSK